MATNYHNKTRIPPSISEDNLFSGHEASVEGIDFASYDEIEVVRSGRDADAYQQLESFEIEDLPTWLTRNISLCGYYAPTPVQKHAIPVAIQGRDLMCCAQTGSGKTAAFLLPAV